MTIRNILLILNILALIGTLIWLKTDQSWEPLVGTITLVGTLIAQLFNNGNDNNQNGTKYIQKGGKNSKNYQSNRDININN
jgi:hypothetical protein